MLGDRSDYTKNACEQALDAVVLEQHIAREHLRDDAAQAPHVNFVVVLATKNDLGSAVGA